MWRDFNRVDDGDLPMADGRRPDVPGVRAAAYNNHRLPDEITGAMQGGRIRDLLGHRRRRERSNRGRRMDE